MAVRSIFYVLYVLLIFFGCIFIFVVTVVVLNYLFAKQDARRNTPKEEKTEASKADASGTEASQTASSTSSTAK
ncbi:hypothetical protein BaRGS_00022001 [Batillaria attramentaria]|uniref:ATP synthase F0 subunit 8 n=1 Tax=Batillaria attramentaria TaxID=370345 RepID=A0ABD0KI63_9CAEN